LLFSIRKVRYGKLQLLSCWLPVSPVKVIRYC